MSDKSPGGFLVVLLDGEYHNPRNPRYLGVDRVPAQPFPGGELDYPEEAAAMDAYVFGDYKDIESNVIPDYDRARELLEAFSSSRRAFELLMVCSGPEDPIRTRCGEAASQTPLGYDVASVSGDCWSIVEDIPESDWARPYLARLSDAGLLPSRQIAERYLEEYRQHKEPDWDSVPFEIVYLVRVTG
jgi:hypothetical protein